MGWPYRGVLLSNELYFHFPRQVRNQVLFLFISIIFTGSSHEPYANAVHLACACWSFHYGKRLFETIAIHRFSHGTMPLLNVFKVHSFNQSDSYHRSVIRVDHIYRAYKLLNEIRHVSKTLPTYFLQFLFCTEVTRA